MTPDQCEFSFGRPHGGHGGRGGAHLSENADGLNRWRESFDATRRELAQKLGLPLDRNVEVWLRDGVRLRGQLCLHDRPLLVVDQEKYQLELQVDHVVFRQSEIESCVALD